MKKSKTFFKKYKGKWIKFFFWSLIIPSVLIMFSSCSNNLDALPYKLQNEPWQIVLKAKEGLYFLNMRGDYFPVFENPKEQKSGLKNYPTFSPKGNQIAYRDYDKENYRIIIYNVETKLKRSIFSSRISFTNLSWSPDGQKLLFLNDYRDEFESMDLCIIDIASKEKRIVADDCVNAIFPSTPSWSRDSKKILFSGLNNQIMEVNVYNNMLTSLFSGICPSYSPNGKHIIYRKGKNEFVKTNGRIKYNISGYDYYIYEISHGLHLFLFNGADKRSSGSKFRGAITWSPDSAYAMFYRSLDLPFREKIYLIDIKSKMKFLFTKGFPHTPGAISWTARCPFKCKR